MPIRLRPLARADLAGVELLKLVRGAVVHGQRGNGLARRLHEVLTGTLDRPGHSHHSPGARQRPGVCPASQLARPGEQLPHRRLACTSEGQALLDVFAGRQDCLGLLASDQFVGQASE